jgi:regulator of sirC expression with transglutaminase-like and TPR domain
MQELRELLAGTAGEVPLDVAALQIATIEYPEVSVEPFLILLDSYATEAAEYVDGSLEGEDFVVALNSYLFDELGFHGNTTDYYSAANSCLNEVLTKRTGIPITLSLVYMEIGRRLGRRIEGIGLPGHFVVRYSDAEFETFIDPFNGGKLLDVSDCINLALDASGLDISGDAGALRPVSNRHIAIRMLNNLRAVYFRVQNVKKAVRVLDLLIGANPRSAEEYKQRGMLLAQLGDYAAAARDFEQYLDLAPITTDRDQIMRYLMRIRDWDSRFE